MDSQLLQESNLLHIGYRMYSHLLATQPLPIYFYTVRGVMLWVSSAFNPYKFPTLLTEFISEVLSFLSDMTFSQSWYNGITLQCYSNFHLLSMCVL